MQPKRKHRHIVEIGLSLLYKSNLPYNYWSYAFSIAVYLINILPSSVLNFKSPWQSLYSKPPLLHALKSFGCACYPYLTLYNKNKLNPSPKRASFLDILHYPRVISALILLQIEFTLLVLFCSMNPFFLLLIILPVLILIFLLHLIFLIAFLPHLLPFLILLMFPLLVILHFLWTSLLL